MEETTVRRLVQLLPLSFKKSMSANKEIILVILIVASTCTAIYFLPKLIKAIKERNEGNIIPLTLIMMLTGSLLWIIYGIMKNDLNMIISNSTSFAPNSIINILAVYYRLQSTRSLNGKMIRGNTALVIYSTSPTSNSSLP